MPFASAHATFNQSTAPTFLPWNELPYEQPPANQEEKACIFTLEDHHTLKCPVTLRGDRSFIAEYEELIKWLEVTNNEHPISREVISPNDIVALKSQEDTTSQPNNQEQPCSENP